MTYKTILKLFQLRAGLCFSYGCTFPYYVIWLWNLAYSLNGLIDLALWGWWLVGCWYIYYKVVSSGNNYGCVYSNILMINNKLINSELSVGLDDKLFVFVITRLHTIISGRKKLAVFLRILSCLRTKCRRFIQKLQASCYYRLCIYLCK